MFNNTHVRCLEDDVEVLGTPDSSDVQQDVSQESLEKPNEADLRRDLRNTPSISVPCHSRRIPRLPDKYCGYAFNASLEDQVMDPISYNKAVTDIDADLWHRVYNSESKLLYFNKVWVIVEAPKRIKPVGYK